MDTRPSEPSRLSFGELVRRYRETAGLTQEELAERAGLSVRGLRYLEQGVRHPYRDTVRRLASALVLTTEEHGALEATGRASGPFAPSPPSRPPHNLPAQPTPFLGREGEVALVRQRLLHPEVRLVALTGPGGVGKTRLALRVAADMVDEFPDGVFVAFLAALGDQALVASAVARVLGIREAGGQPLADTLCAFLRDKQMLLVLDNFEHMMAAAPLVATLLEASPGLTVLVTSRVLLRLSGEHILLVPPLALPAPHSAEPPEQLQQYEAVRLFVERAQAMQPGFALTAADAAAVVEICRRLDGLPLALELAAARIRLLSPWALLGRLGSRLSLLTDGARDRPPHQQTLRATLAWSYELLDTGEQQLFRRLSVFTGGCTLQAAGAVCTVRDGGTEGEVLDALASLADKSLLRAEEQPDSLAETGEPRFVLLETVREYGLEQLVASGEQEALLQAHARYYLALAEEAESQLEGPRQGPWLARLERELDNLRAALGWAAEGETPAAARRLEVGLRLAAALRMFWFRRGLMNEGRSWLDRLLDLTERTGDTAGAAGPRAKALVAASHLAWGQSDLEGVQTLAQRGLALAREAGDTRTSARALYYLGVEAHQRRAHRRAVALVQVSQALAREAGDTRTSMMTLIVLGRVAHAQGDVERATALLEEAMGVAQQRGDPWGTASARLVLAYVARAQGAYERATALAEQALALTQALGAKDTHGFALNVLGTLALEQGDAARAVQRAEESLTLFQAMGLPPGCALALALLGDVASAQGKYGQALAHHREALALLRRGGRRGRWSSAWRS